MGKLRGDSPSDIEVILALDPAQSHIDDAPLETVQLADVEPVAQTVPDTEPILNHPGVPIPSHLADVK